MTLGIFMAGCVGITLVAISVSLLGLMGLIIRDIIKGRL